MVDWGSGIMRGLMCYGGVGRSVAAYVVYHVCELGNGEDGRFALYTIEWKVSLDICAPK